MLKKNVMRSIQKGGNPLLCLLSWGYALIIKGRNLAYDKGLFQVKKLPIPVISVGNIAACGTGKTPFVHLLASLLSCKARCAIVTRGFKSKKEQKNVRLDLKDPQASLLYGDEPTLLAQKTQLPVFVGKNRFKSGKMACQEEIECILLDDGMQHRRLHRDVEVVIVDAKDPFCSHRFLPNGLLRDEVRRLQKADLIVALPVRKEAEYEAISKKLKQVTDAPVVGMYKEPIWTHVDVTRVALFCGIGRPEQFVQTVRDLKLEIVDTLFSMDHELPTQEQLEAFALRSQKKGAQLIVCTEKDRVKLSSGHLKKGAPLPVDSGKEGSDIPSIVAIPIALKVGGGKEKWETFLKTVENKVKHHE